MDSCEIQSAKFKVQRCGQELGFFVKILLFFVAFLLLRDTDAECQSLFVVSTDKFTRVREFFGFGFVFVVGLFSFDF